MEDGARSGITAEGAAQELMGVVHQLRGFVRFTERPVFMAQLCQAIERGMARGLSDHMCPESAAAHADCSVSFIYQMFGAGVIQRYGGPGMPVASKKEIDEAIRSGRWCSGKGRKKMEGGR